MSLQDTILNSIHRAVVATDPEGNITYWNDTAAALYGWSAAEVIGRNVTEVTPSEASHEQAEEIMEHLRAGEIWEGLFRVRRKDGSEFNAFVADSPVLDDEGHLTGIVGISHEVAGALEEQQLLHVGLMRGVDQVGLDH